jgi:hypothetical protein
MLNCPIRIRIKVLKSALPEPKESELNSLPEAAPDPYYFIKTLRKVMVALIHVRNNSS